MEPVYVFGHRNPDMDSVVSAIAYAALRNALGDWEYEAVCLGQPNDETIRILDRFGLPVPRFMADAFTQVKDLDLDKPTILASAVTVGRAWTAMQGQRERLPVVVVNEDGTLYGLLAWEDVANYHMNLVSSSYLRPVPIYNLLSVLEGKLLNEGNLGLETVSGEVVVALPSGSSLPRYKKDTLVVCGNQPEMIRNALEQNVNCLVLCQSSLSEPLRNIPTTTTIIMTPYDAYRTVRLIFHAVPVGRICRRSNLKVFHLDDLLDEVKEQVLKHKNHAYPVLSGDEKVAGLLTRQHLLRPRRKRVVLVDHNESSQSVPGLKEAEILEIIDHHRLADIQTSGPIFMRNEPVGATATIVAEMYQERGLMPSANLAGIMAAAIISDTVLFKSPTCTQRDVKMAERLAYIANVSLDELGKLVFSTVREDKDAATLIASDYKEFHIAGHDLAVAQIICVDSTGLLSRKEEFLQEMRRIAATKKYAILLFMLTDVLLDGTQVLYVGDDEIIEQAFNAVPRENTVFLPKVMSRKKQVIPCLSALWG